MSSATIYDVATEANVSIATVSRVLNSPQQVNESTRQRVLSAIDTLRYVPRADATARARRSNRRIGVLTPHFTSPSFVQRLRGIANVLDSTQYELVVYPVDSVSKCRSHLETLPIARRIDGLILMSLRIDDAVADRLQQHGLQTVLIETSHPLFSGVEIDNQQGGFLATEYLINKGHQRIAFIGGDIEFTGNSQEGFTYSQPVAKMRLTGCRQALEQAGIDLPDKYVRVSKYGIVNAEEEAHALFDLPEPPSAIFAVSDEMAMGVLKAARARSLHLPDDIAVIGFDGLDTADYLGLTTVSQSLDESGRIGLELLLSRLAEPERMAQHVRLPLRVLEGITT